MQRVIFIASWLGLSIVYSAYGAAPVAIPTDPRWGDLPGTNTVFKPAKSKTLDEWQDRRAWLREQVRFVAGLVPEPERTPLNAKVFDKREFNGVSIEKVQFESQPGLYVLGNLYRPVMIEGKIPAVACALGHWAHGRLHQDDSGNFPALGRTLAKLGVTVFIYDMTGYNEGARQFGRHDEGHGVNTPARDLWGITSLGLQTWNSIRVLDFLQSLPEVDPQRIGMTGASGGGTQTFILNAVDDRVKAAVPVNMISSTMQGGCACENAPCLRIDANNMEIGACVAPKPMLMISTSGDWTARTPKVEYPFVRGIYELYGRADVVTNVHLAFPHNYNKASREAMYAFFARTLLNHSDAVREVDLPTIDPKELLVWTDQTAPKDLLTFDKLAPQIQAREENRLAAMAPQTPEKLKGLTAAVRTGLMHIIGSPFPKAQDVRLIETSKTPATYYERNGRRVKWGISASSSSSKPSSVILRSTWPVAAGGSKDLWVPPVGWEAVNFTAFAPSGNAGPTHDGKPRGSTEYFSTFNRMDAAESAYDVLTVLATELLHSRRERITLAGSGEMGPVCLVARAIIPDELVKNRGLRTAIDMNGFDVDSDAAYLKELNLPHIRRIGGLRAVAAVACNGPIWFHNVGEHFDDKWIKAAGKINGTEVRITREKADDKAIVQWLTK
jgi:hypothetical protein